MLAFQFVLILVAYCLGVDLESEYRSAATITVEVWVVGTVAGAAGLLLGHFGRRGR